MKTKETNPTRPGSPTPCKQALNFTRKSAFYLFLKKGIKKLVVGPIKVRYFKARHCRLFELECDYQVFLLLLNKLLYRITLLCSAVKSLMLQPAIGR